MEQRANIKFCFKLGKTFTETFELDVGKLLFKLIIRDISRIWYQDFHIFRSLQNSLNERNLNNFETMKSAIRPFFNNKSEDFYSFHVDGKLSQIVVENT
ncbi:hypothetical protein WH47_06300 [Habropoda laboriosa]|uniref:Histone-lysine N-methyltransferase SETMAR n=1 Tax=Habropoda laboriosa TaxID=597456 RepID=A0A0L7QS38_9HYME|nr:hypothetical protein WH47_06300 [Habropoda laboriosa]